MTLGQWISTGKSRSEHGRDTPAYPEPMNTNYTSQSQGDLTQRTSDSNNKATGSKRKLDLHDSIAQLRVGSSSSVDKPRKIPTLERSDNNDLQADGRSNDDSESQHSLHSRTDLESGDLEPKKEQQQEEGEEEQDEGEEEGATGESAGGNVPHSSTPKKIFPKEKETHVSLLAQRHNPGSVSSMTSEDDDQSRRRMPPHASTLPKFTNTPPHELAARHNYPTAHKIPYERSSSTGRDSDARSRRKHHSDPSDALRLDMKYAKNRLQTFENFWDEDSEFKNTKVLVANGFYATGVGDEVKCFACSVRLANWDRNDDARQRHAKNSPKCGFVNGERCGNRPLEPIRKSRKSPENSTSRGRGYNTRSSRHQTDRNASRDHLLRSSSPRISQRPPRETPSTVDRPSSRASTRASSRAHPARVEAPAVTGPVPPEEYENLLERVNLLEQFPCAYPMNPSMRNVNDRLRTFTDSQFRANTQLRASNITLAEAGMHYDGSADWTKCWYCSGGLKDYLADDDPWVEHAKYFPECEYLLQQRGPAWIADVSASFPNVERPPFPGRRNQGVAHHQAAPAPRASPQHVPQVPQAAPVAPQQHATRFPPVPPVHRPTTPQRTEDIPHLPRLEPTPLIRQVPTPNPAPAQPQFEPTPLVREVTPRTPTSPQPPQVPAPAPRAAEPANPPPPPQPQHAPVPPEASMIEDPQALLRQREQMVEASMHSEQVQAARDMGFNVETIKAAQMRRVIGLGSCYQSLDLLVEALLNPEADPRTLEGAPPQQQRRNNATNITITGGNFTQGTVFGAGRPRRQRRNLITINGMSLEDYIAQNQNVVYEPPPRRAVFNNVGTTVSTGPYNTAPTPSAPVTEPTTTPSSNDIPSTSTNPPEATGTAEERLEALQKERQCKICYSAPMEVLFEPCGHICACMRCASHVTQCPMCRKTITRYIRTYHC